MALFISVIPASCQLPTVCVAPSTIHVSQSDTCETLGDAATHKFAVSAMRGEEENGQLLVDTRGWPPSSNLTLKLTISIETFKTARGYEVGSGPRTQWWQVGYVNCRPTTRYPGSGGGWRPDPLLPPDDDDTVLLESETTQPFWLSVKVPRDMPAGDYSSRVLVTVLETHAGSTIAIPVELTVWNITLPELGASKFPAIFCFNSEALEHVYGRHTSNMTRKYLDLFIDQRIAGNDLYTRVPANLSTAKYLADAGVQWLSLMDIYGVAASGLNRDITDLQGACLNFTQDLVDKALEILAPVVSAAENMDILDKMFVYGFDEAPSSCETSIRTIYAALKQKWPKLKTVATVNWQPRQDTPMDVWVLQYQMYNSDKAASWLKAGKQQWWYHCIEPSGLQYLNSFIERPQLETRLLFWLASSHDVAGWLYYSVAMWKRYPLSHSLMNRINNTARTDFDPANYIWYPRTDIFANGDGNFVYPGADGPIPTQRLHNLRDGFEDAELFKMLPVDQVKSLVQPLVRSATDYTIDPLLFERQREKAAIAVMKLAK